MRKMVYFIAVDKVAQMYRYNWFVITLGRIFSRVTGLVSLGANGVQIVSCVRATRVVRGSAHYPCLVYNGPSASFVLSQSVAVQRFRRSSPCPGYQPANLAADGAKISDRSHGATSS